MAGRSSQAPRRQVNPLARCEACGQVLAQEGGPRKADFTFVTSNKEQIYRFVDDVSWIRAEDACLRFVMANGEELWSYYYTIQGLADRFPHLIRISRSTLVNPEQVLNFIGTYSDRLVSLRGGFLLSVARRQWTTCLKRVAAWRLENEEPQPSRRLRLRQPPP